MTRMEQAELEQLGMDESALAAKTAQMDALAKSGATHPYSISELDETHPIPPANGKPVRAKRSDAGTKRPAKARPAGTLSVDQWAHLGVLVERVTQSAVNLRDARVQHDQLLAEYHDYLDGLKAK